MKNITYKGRADGKRSDSLTVAGVTLLRGVKTEVSDELAKTLADDETYEITTHTSRSTSGETS